ncbi:SDR family oxidoreductase [Streptomyces virginiae]|uniref:SDR family oxidoreductase n=1 Tax=Streptomyces TaxID=1883 RepID=UPI00052473C2|nr:NAD(P)H-binding protein [Streptomyces virginiae]MYV74741.1 NAD(P)H-binding protein [Streptomyces sp. SID1046]WSC81157.1 NAD(P)H-binding protein [Streptomyces virginiae]
MTILVTGATGNVGRQVVRRLVEAGEDVRALTRSPETAGLPAGARVVAGDLARPETLPGALAGVEKMFLFPVLETAEKVVELAVAAGVRRIVLLSSATVTAGYDTEYHLPVERAVEASGVEWTHVRPGEFAVNSLHMWGPSIRATRSVVDPYPDRGSTPIHEWDIADVAAAALVEARHVNTAYTLAGPQTLTQREQVAAIAAAIGEDIRIEELGVAEARAFYHRQGGWAAANADFLLGYEDYSGVESAPAEPADLAEAEPEQAPGTVTADAVTGRPARPYTEWARDHAADFR